MLQVDTFDTRAAILTEGDTIRRRPASNFKSVKQRDCNRLCRRSLHDPVGVGQRLATSAMSTEAPDAACSELPRQLRHNLEQIADQADVGDLKDRRVLILVDRDDRL